MSRGIGSLQRTVLETKTLETLLADIGRGPPTRIFGTHLSTLVLQATAPSVSNPFSEDFLSENAGDQGNVGLDVSVVFAGLG